VQWPVESIAQPASRCGCVLDIMCAFPFLGGGGWGGGQSPLIGSPNLQDGRTTAAKRRGDRLKPSSPHATPKDIKACYPGEQERIKTPVNQTSTQDATKRYNADDVSDIVLAQSLWRRRLKRKQFKGIGN